MLSQEREGGGRQRVSLLEYSTTDYKRLATGLQMVVRLLVISGSGSVLFEVTSESSGPSNKVWLLIAATVSLVQL